MQLIKGNIWESASQNIAITTNSVIRTDGSLVMGAGIAKEAALKYPDLAYKAGQLISALNKHTKWYGFIGSFSYPDRNIYLFQTKTLFTRPSCLKLIEHSTEMMIEYLNQNPIEISLNFPGIGKGGLDSKKVLPIIEQLPDSVTVFYQ